MNRSILKMAFLMMTCFATFAFADTCPPVENIFVHNGNEQNKHWVTSNGWISIKPIDQGEQIIRFSRAVAFIKIPQETVATLYACEYHTTHGSTLLLPPNPYTVNIQNDSWKKIKPNWYACKVQEDCKFRQ